MNEEWTNIGKLGCLYIEKVLVRFDIPLLFVCNTKSNEKYLTLCINEETNEFLLAKCNNDTLLKLVDGQQSIDSAFKTAKNLFLVDYGSGRCKNLNIKELSEDMLPDKDTFFTIKNPSIDEYLETLKNEYEDLNYNTEEVFLEMDTSYMETLEKIVMGYVGKDSIKTIKRIKKNSTINKHKQTRNHEYKNVRGNGFGQGWEKDTVPRIPKETYDFKEGVTNGQSSAA